MNRDSIEGDEEETWTHLVGERVAEVPKLDWGEYCNARRSRPCKTCEEEDRTCGERQFVGYCRAEAGKGTAHFGEGRCRMHGGATPRGAENPNFEHGIFSDYLSEDDKLAVEAIGEYENEEKLQEIIDWRITKLRRMLAAKEDDMSTSFWDAYKELIRSADTIGADEIKELAKLAAGEDNRVRAEIDQIRKLIKDHNQITEGQKINMSPSDQWRVGLMAANQEVEESDSDETEEDE